MKRQLDDKYSPIKQLVSKNSLLASPQHVNASQYGESTSTFKKPVLSISPIKK